MILPINWGSHPDLGGNREYPHREIFTLPLGTFETVVEKC